MDDDSQNRYYCKECCREITKEEMKKNAGLCEKCFGADDEEDTKIYNKTARLIKQLSALLAVVGVIVGVCFLANSAYLGIVTTIVSILMYIFFKSFGEIIQLLEDIKNK